MRAPNQRTMESYMLSKGKKGDTFYTHKEDKHVTSIATYYEREISTARVVSLEGTLNKPAVRTLTKVTIKK